MSEPKTDARLLQRMKQAARSQLTAEQIDEQRVSFIMSALSEKNTATRAKVTQILAQHEGRLANA